MSSRCSTADIEPILNEKTVNRLASNFNANAKKQKPVRELMLEYIDVCKQYVDDNPPPNFHSSFVELVDEVRVTFLDGIKGLDATDRLTQKVKNLVTEVSQRVTGLAIQIVDDSLPDRVIKFSEHTWVDPYRGLAVQQWDDHKEVKCSLRAVEECLQCPGSVFHSPLMVATEVAGRAFVGMTLAPVKNPAINAHSSPSVKVHLNNLAVPHHVPLNNARLKELSLLAYGSDTRWYLLDARGIMPKLYMRTECDYAFEGDGESNDRAEFRREVQFERCCDEISHSSFDQRSLTKVLHTYGIPVTWLHALHAELEKREKLRGPVMVAEGEIDPLRVAIRAVVTEILVRVTKRLIRELWREMDVDDIPANSITREMRRLANNVLETLLTDNGFCEDHYPVFYAMLKHSTRWFNDLKNDSIKNIVFSDVDQSLFIKRLAHLLNCAVRRQGMNFVTVRHRLVRTTTVYPSRLYTDALTGKHKVILSAEVRRCRVARTFSPWRHPYLCLQLAYLVGSLGKDLARHGPDDVFKQLDMSLVEEEQHECFLAERRALEALQMRSEANPAIGLAAFMEASTAMSRMYGPETPIGALMIAERVKVVTAIAQHCQDASMRAFLDGCLNSLQLFRNSGQIDPKQASWLWLRIFDTIGKQQQGNIERALENAEMRKVFLVKVFGEQSEFSARCRNELGVIHANAGNLEQARSYFEEAVAIYELLTEDDRDNVYFAAVSSLSSIYYSMAERSLGDTRKKLKMMLKPKFTGEAETLIHKSDDLLTSVYPRLHGVSDFLRADILHNAGSVKIFLGDFQAAEKFYTEFLEVCQKIYPENHPDHQMALKDVRMLERRRKGNAVLRIQTWNRKRTAARQVEARRIRFRALAQAVQPLGRAFITRRSLVGGGKQRLPMKHSPIVSNPSPIELAAPARNSVSEPSCVPNPVEARAATDEPYAEANDIELLVGSQVDAEPKGTEVLSGSHGHVDATNVEPMSSPSESTTELSESTSSGSSSVIASAVDEPPGHTQEVSEVPPQELRTSEKSDSFDGSIHAVPDGRDSPPPTWFDTPNDTTAQPPPKVDLEARRDTLALDFSDDYTKPHRKSVDNPLVANKIQLWAYESDEEELDPFQQYTDSAPGKTAKPTWLMSMEFEPSSEPSSKGDSHDGVRRKSTAKRLKKKQSKSKRSKSALLMEESISNAVASLQRIIRAFHGRSLMARLHRIRSVTAKRRPRRSSSAGGRHSPSTVVVPRLSVDETAKGLLGSELLKAASQDALKPSTSEPSPFCDTSTTPRAPSEAFMSNSVSKAADNVDPAALPSVSSEVSLEWYE